MRGGEECRKFHKPRNNSPCLDVKDKSRLHSREIGGKKGTIVYIQIVSVGGNPLFQKDDITENGAPCRGCFRACRLHSSHIADQRKRSEKFGIFHAKLFREGGKGIRSGRKRL